MCIKLRFNLSFTLIYVSTCPNVSVDGLRLRKVEGETHLLAGEAAARLSRVPSEQLYTYILEQ